MAQCCELLKFSGQKVPILGINFGHVGFLAEIERPSLTEIVERLLWYFSIEERMSLNYQLLRGGKVFKLVGRLMKY
jgi:NAD+ kinase